MKVFVNGSMHDSKFGPIALVFDNDDDRKRVADLLYHMTEINDVRIFAEFPLNHPNMEAYMKRVRDAAGSKENSSTIHIKP